MRVLQINSHYKQGGAAQIVAYIHRQLLLDGHEAYVAFGRGKGWKEKNIYRFNRIHEIYFSAFMSRIIGINGWYNRIATRRLLQFIKSVQPDVIHLHALHGYYLNFSMFFSYVNEHDIPCVWTFHDCHAFTGNCGYSFACEKWKNGCGDCPHVQGYPSSQFFDFTRFMWRRKKDLFTAGKRKIIVTPSRWLTDMAKESFFKKYPCITIHNGIDVNKQFFPRDRRKCREKYGFSQEEKLILGIAIGYKDPRKGAKFIIQMAQDMEKEARVILIGWNEKEDILLRGTKNIIAMPPIDSADVLAEYYSMADVFVLPSLAENYATVSLEAMACGTPVVGFDAGGIPEQLEGGKGIAVETGNQKKFTEAVRKALYQECGLLRGDELAKLIRQENSAEKMVAKYVDLYKSLGNGDRKRNL